MKILDHKWNKSLKPGLWLPALELVIKRNVSYQTSSKPEHYQRFEFVPQTLQISLHGRISLVFISPLGCFLDVIHVFLRTDYVHDLIRLGACPWYVTLQKDISHLSSVIFIFLTPPTKLKLGLQIDGRLLIANHLEQSSWLANERKNKDQQSDHIYYTLLWQV
jgi:hypothetical protein